MRDVKMPVDELIAAITANRAEHVALFEKAYDAYEAQVREAFHEVVARLRSHKVHEVDIAAPYRLTRPENHVEDYDVTLAMLADETRSKIKLSRAEYEQYVQDNWGWKAGFTRSAVAYLGE